MILTWRCWWWWKIAGIVENFLSKHYETVTLVCFDDKWIFDIKWKKIRIWPLFNFSFPWLWYIEIIHQIINTIKYIKKEKPSIVIWFGSYYNLLWLVAKKFLDFKLLLTQHEHISSQKSILPKLSSYHLIYFMIRRLIWNNKILCVSDEVRSDTIKHYRIKESQAQTVYNWLDFDEIWKLWNDKIDIKEKYIINIWRLDAWKNQELLIKAYGKSKIKEKYKLLLLWEWYMERPLKNLCKTLNIEASVIFAWFDKNPYKYLKNASLFCFTSLTEALPTVLIESLILDIPIITVPVMWAKEILNNGKFWIITKNYEEETLVKELDNLVEWWKKSLNNGKQNFLNKNFSIEAMGKKYLKIIRNL